MEVSFEKRFFWAIAALLFIIHFVVLQSRVIKENVYSTTTITTKGTFKDKDDDDNSITFNTQLINLLSSSSSTLHRRIQKDEKREIRSVHEQRKTEEEQESDEEEDEEGLELSETETITNENFNETDSPADTTTPRRAYNHLDFATPNAAHLSLHLEIVEVIDINEIAEIVTVVIDGRIHWNDYNDMKTNYFSKSKLWNDSFIVKPGFFQKIWIPNIKFLQNAKPSRRAFINQPSLFVYTEETQQITYLIKSQTIKLKCDMDFTYYPADTQSCNFSIVSMNLDRLVTMAWGKMMGDSLTDNNFEVQLKSFEGKFKPDHPNVRDDAYVILMFTVSMRRKIGYHVVQTYLPSILYILITCLCFLVPSHMVEVRIGISMTTLLTLTAMFGSVRESTPTVSYIKAIDIWMAFCIFFVFLTLFEFTTLLWLRWQRKTAEKKRMQNQKMLDALKNVIGGKCVGAPVFGLQRSFSVESLHYRRHERFSELVEKYGCAVFSVVFLIFNVIYWSWLIKASGYYKWQINQSINYKDPLHDILT